MNSVGWVSMDWRMTAHRHTPECWEEEPDERPLQDFEQPTYLDYEHAQVCSVEVDQVCLHRA